MNKFIEINKEEFLFCISQLQDIQIRIFKVFGVDDIFSNSKIYEIVIANELCHNLIPGHSGSKDAYDENGIYEYKHYKESSSNHTWTFNDYSDTTIENLSKAESVIFAHINDNVFPPTLDWYLNVNGKVCSEYLYNRTSDLLNRKPKGKVNARRMINISPIQIMRDLNIKKQIVNNVNKNGKYYDWIMEITNLINHLEHITNVKGILTSNKIWEVIVAVELGHNVNSEQGGRDGAHDAFDNHGNEYEYKVSKSFSWNFQDISENVLKKYLNDKSIILAVVDKSNMTVRNIYSANPISVVDRLKNKLEIKSTNYIKRNKEIRRKQITLTKQDLIFLNAIQII